MKPQFHCFRLIPVLAAGLMISPLAAQSPDRPGPPPRGDNPREAPQPDRIQAAVRQMVELRQAGKHDEARAISERLNEAAKSNPEMAKQISEAMKHQRPAAKPEARPDAPRPNAAEGPMRRGGRGPQAPGHQMTPPNLGRGQHPAMGRPPGMPQGRPLAMRPDAATPQPPVVRPNVEAARRANAGKGEVAKIRHLRQASEHLAAAGLAEHAAKARAEADRMTATLKASQPQAQPGQPQRKPDRKPDQAKPDRKPDVNAAILGELRKMGSQLGELSARVRKLEAQEKAAQ